VTRSLLILLVLIALPLPVMSQQHPMSQSDFKSYLSSLSSDSQRWTTTVSSVDLAAFTSANPRNTKLMKVRQAACLKALGNLREGIVRAAAKSTLHNQLAVLNAITSASDSLSAFQDSLEFSEIANQEKAEKWIHELSIAFEQSSAQSATMLVHMSQLAEVVDSKIDVNSITDSDLMRPAKPR